MAEALITVSRSRARGFTNAVQELIDDGMIDRDMLISELLLWMSEDDVERFCRSSHMFRDEDNECVIREDE